MLKIYLSSTFRDLSGLRSNILDKLDIVFEGVGMKKFIPDGSNIQETSIRNLKESDFVIFLISPYYGTLMDTCSLENECKAECSMKTGKRRISYTHCEYKIAIAEEIYHHTYLIDDPSSLEFLEKTNQSNKGFNELKKMKYLRNLLAHNGSYSLEINKFSDFEKEISKEMYSIISDSDDKKIVNLITQNLAFSIIKLHSAGKISFNQFVDRREELSFLLENIDNKTEVYGVGGIGKTALIQVALLIQKLKGNKIISIGSQKTYASGSGLEYFRKMCKDDQYAAESQNIITIYDILNALIEAKLLFEPEELKKKPKKELVELLSNQIRKEENLTVFIDDFHYADDDVRNLVMLLDDVIIASRKRTNLARKEILLTGFEGEYKEDLINLYAKKKLPAKVKKVIEQITEGHPVSTEFLVKNYEKIDFNKLKDFSLEDADHYQINEFNNRVIEEIFSSNKQALALLKNLAVLNIDLGTNINREVVYHSYDIDNPMKHFKELLDTGMLKKKKGKEGIYEFCYIHIKDALEDIADIESHKKAIKYYEKKKELIGDFSEDEVELLFHEIKFNPNDDLVKNFIELGENLLPFHYERLIDIGEELKNKVEDKFKISILFNLGILYLDLKKFEETERNLLEALKIGEALREKDPEVILPSIVNILKLLGKMYSELGKFDLAEKHLLDALKLSKVLIEKVPEVYLPNIVDTQNNLGTLYRKLGRFEEAENTYQEALELYKKLADKYPKDILPIVANIYNNLGTLYWNLGRFEEAERSYEEALELRKELAAKNPDAYKPDVAMTQYNLGILYRNLGRFEEAENAFQEALEIKIKLAEKNPDAYKPDVAMTQNNLGSLYLKLRRFEEAEKAYTEALKIHKELAAKNPDAYNPDVAMTQNNLGILYNNLGRYNDAIDCYNRVLEIDPEYIDAWNNKGNMLYSLKKYEEAIECYNKVLEIDPEYIDVWFSKGAALAWLKRYDQATECYDKSLALDRNYGIAWYNKACLESTRKNKEKSVEFLKKAIDLDKKYIEMAKSDEDFDNVRTSKEFKEIIGE